MQRLLIAGGTKLAGDESVLRVAERLGCQLLTATDHDSAMQIVAAERPFAVLVDHRVGNPGALRLLTQIRERHPECQVIFVTPGGELDVAIEVLRAGALDYLRYPIDPDQLGEALQRAQRLREPGRVDDRTTLLVLEDHEPTRRRVAEVLKNEGYRVFAGVDGEEGAKLLREIRFDLVVADLKMPKKDGLTLLREAKSAGLDAAFILVTAYATEEVVVAALREGAVDFLTKPLDLDQLFSAIRSEIDRQVARRTAAFGNRDLAVTQALAIQLTRELALVVKAHDKLRSDTASLLDTLANAVAGSVVMVDSTRTVRFASRYAIDKLGPAPQTLSARWLAAVAGEGLTDESLNAALQRVMVGPPSAIETLTLNNGCALVMAPFTLTQPKGIDQCVAIMIHAGGKPSR